MNIKTSNSTFLLIKEDFPLIKSLRNYFNSTDFQNLTYSNNIKKNKDLNLEEFPISKSFSDLKDKVELNPKGKKSLLWINPRPGLTTGLLSDTLLDFIVLDYAPDNVKNFLIRKRKSKYYLLKGWKPRSQNTYCEPIFIKEGLINDDNFENKLIKPLAYYWDKESQIKSTEIDYYLPFKFIEHHISEGPKYLDHGRRIDKKILIEWGYIEEIDGEYAGYTIEFY